MRALLNQIVDYAGLFPPAKLAIDAALDTYLRNRESSPHRWMLGRFVCPATRLTELAALAKGRADGQLLQVAALGQQSAGPGDFLAHLRADIEMIEDFRAGWGNDAVIDVLEVALPRDATIALLHSQLAHVPEEVAQASLTGFLEVPISSSWDADMTELGKVLNEMRHTQPHGIIGMKLRCGGPSADAFPSDAQVASFIARCTENRLRWKATAGLHHPHRHWDDTLRVWHHGFLNIFTAGVLAHTHTLTEAVIADILADRGGEFFRFEGDRLSWRNWSADATQIAEARRYGPTTFGSCSFEEPCADLAAMGLLDDCVQQRQAPG